MTPARRTVLSAPLLVAPLAARAARPAPLALTLAPSRDHLMRGGRPFFYLADTAWAAFTNPTDEEWRYYLDQRRAQGFNALQINVLPQGDRSRNAGGDDPLPFAPDADGKFDFDRPNAAYFEKAARLTAMAVDRGFVPALVLLWGNVVPGTWMVREFKSKTMTLAQVKAYVPLVVRHLGRFAPLWIVSGDSDLPEEAKPFYRTARDLVKQLTPQLPCTFHLSPKAALPDDWTDVHMTYSGHGHDSQAQAYLQAAERSARKPRRPVINGEPCYEAHGRGAPEGAGGAAMDRWSAFEVRRAAWWHLLSGGKAGLAYGAHGVWCWHRTGQRFNNEKFARHPLDWRAALNLPGAWDMGFARRLWEQHRLYELTPRQDLLADAPASVRCAATGDGGRLAIYVPYARSVTVRADLATYEVTAVNLAERRHEWPAVTAAGATSTTIAMTESNADVLLLAARRR